MKKRIIHMIVAVILLTVSMPANAEESFDFTWKGDYQNTELVLTVVSPVKYLQQVIAVMYDSAITNPTVNDYVRIAEITLSGGESANIRFKIADDLTADGGKYTVRIQGNGHAAGQSQKKKDVVVLTPQAVDPDNPLSLLYRLNTATAENVSVPLQEMAKALQIEVGENESAIRLNAFLNIRREDNGGGKFATVNAAADAWRVSDISEYLQGNPTADNLKMKFEAVAEILNIDLTNQDYKAYTSDVYSNIIVLKNGGLQVDSFKNLQEIFEKAKALAVLNKSTEKDIAKNLEKYYAAVGITKADYDAYAGCEENTREKIERNLLYKNFSSTQAAKEEFEKALSDLGTNLEPTPTPTQPSNSGPQGSGFTSRRDEYKYPEENTKQESTFGDCTDSHWAYESVKNLKESDIISGYPDGNFYPERTINREEFVKMVMIAADLFEEGKECDFKDVSTDEWHYKYIASAYSAKIIDGIGEGNFGVGANMKREDVAVIIFRVLQNCGKITDTQTSRAEFSDKENISDYAVEAVSVLSDMGVLNGFEDGSFRPKDYLTRAESAKVLFELRKIILQKVGE